MVIISCTRFQANMAKDQSGIMDLRFGIQLIIHCSDCLLFYSENVIEPTLSHSMRKKTQHSRYSFQFLESLTYYADQHITHFFC